MIKLNPKALVNALDNMVPAIRQPRVYQDLPGPDKYVMSADEFVHTLNALMADNTVVLSPTGGDTISLSAEKKWEEERKRLEDEVKAKREALTRVRTMLWEERDTRDRIIAQQREAISVLKEYRASLRAQVQKLTEALEEERRVSDQQAERDDLAAARSKQEDRAVARSMLEDLAKGPGKL